MNEPEVACPHCGEVAGFKQSQNVTQIVELDNAGDFVRVIETLSDQWRSDAPTSDRPFECLNCGEEVYELPPEPENY